MGSHVLQIYGAKDKHMKTPQYIKALLQPTVSQPKGRKVWSVDLEGIWIPFFTATNMTGDTAIPHDAMGAPLRLAYDTDGSVKFSKSGKPVVRVVREIADSVKLVRENMVAGLMQFAYEVRKADAEGYKAQIEAHMRAGAPIIERDNVAMTDAVMARAEAEAEAVARQAEAEAEAVAVGEKELAGVAS